MGDSLLPHRYCSIKGCKAVVPGNSFFKMCEPCRNRYRSYGTTKRAKWRREKEVAVAELEKMREEENKRRAERNLPVRSSFCIDVSWMFNHIHCSRFPKERAIGTSNRRVAPPTTPQSRWSLRSCQHLLPVCAPSLIVERSYPRNTSSCAVNVTGFRTAITASSKESETKRARLWRMTAGQPV